MPGEIILLNDIFFKYSNSDFQLKFDSLSIQRGTKTAIIGPSGFGKTTLLHLISGIYNPIQGRVSVMDQEVSSMSESQRRTFRIGNIGFVFQDFKLLEYLNVQDNIILPYRINKVLKLNKKGISAAQELASAFGIHDKLKKYPGNLSQGEKQRVAICRALLLDPPIILADEPTGNLDPENKVKIMTILFNYVAEKGSTLITVTHDHELLKGFDKVIDFKELYSLAS